MSDTDSIDRASAAGQLVVQPLEPDILKTAQEVLAAEPKKEKKQSDLPPRFTVTDEGVFFLGDDGEPFKVCSKLIVIAKTKDDSNRGWGRVLSFKDPDGVEHKWPMPASMLAGSGELYRKVLLDEGLEIAPGQKANNRLHDYIQGCKPSRTIASCQRTGWKDGVFVLPDRTIGESEKEIVFQSEEDFSTGLGQKGSMMEWRTNIGAKCIGNSRLIIAVCNSFAAPLAGVVEIAEAAGGVYFKGKSTGGKTTALQVGASVFGGKEFIFQWRATSNGLEAQCRARNHLPIILDEIGEMSPHDIGEAVYMIYNGVGKQRANRTGGSRKSARWQTRLLSSGENGLEEHMASAGKKMKAGQGVRLIEIESDAGAGYQMFENLHGHLDGGSFADSLKDSVSQCYGAVGLAFIEYCAKDRKTVRERHKYWTDNFDVRAVTEGADGQVGRVAKQFGHMAAAGEIATELGLTGWEQGHTFAMVFKLFIDWMEARRGGSGSYEDFEIVRQIQQFVEAHGASRLVAKEVEEDKIVNNRAGYLKTSGDDVVILFLPEVFKSEICKGLNINTVEKALIKKGILNPDSNDKRATRLHRIPGLSSRQRFYEISCGRLLAAIDGESPELYKKHW